MRPLYYFFLLIFLFPLSGIAQQISNWQWADNSNCSTDDAGNDLAVDNNGDVYVVGSFTGTLQIGSATLTSAGGKDIFLAKYNSSGSVLWLKQLGGAGEDDATDVAIDADNMIYIAGSMSAAFTIDTNILANNGGTDILLAKYDQDGDIQWVKSYGGPGSDMATSVTVAHSGKILFAGEFMGPGNVMFGSVSLSAAGNWHDIVVLGLSANGSVDWAKRYGGPGNEHCVDMEVDASDNIYITGQFSSTSNIGGAYIQSISDGFVVGDVYIAKLDMNGNALWARPIGGVKSWSSDAGVLSVNKLAVSASGDVYVVGAYDNCKLKFHNGAMLAHTSQQIFMAKYDMNGNYVWSKQPAKGSYAEANDIYLDTYENIYLTGYCQNSAIFEHDTLHAIGRDVFIAKYYSNGSNPWAINLGDIAAETGNGIFRDQYANIYVTGTFGYGNFSFGGDTLFNTGAKDMFLFKLSDPLAVIRSNRTGDDVILYPNPTTGYAYLQAEAGSFSAISVLDLTGKILVAQTILPGEKLIKLDLHYFPGGTYFLRLDGATGSLNKTLSVQR